MLELVELGELRPAHEPAQLSGGQQQRVALARALINRPQVLLLDEPLGALDLKLRRQMQIELKRIQTEVGITFVHVTHDQEEAMTMADTIAVMNQGVIEQMGAPAELYENPRDHVRGQLPRPVQPGRRPRWSAATASDVVVDVHGSKRRGARGRAPAVPTATVLGRGPAGEGASSPRRTARPLDAPATVLGGGVVSDVSFIGVSTQYLVRMPLGPGAARSSSRTPAPASGFRVGRPGRPALAAGAHLPARRRPGRARRRRVLRGADAAAPRERRAAEVAAEGRSAPSQRRRAGAGRRPATCCCCPGMLWLVVFFVVPTAPAGRHRLYDPNGSLRHRLRDDLGVQQLLATRCTTYWPPFLRSLLYAGVATVLCLVLGYPLAYAIAFKAGPLEEPDAGAGDRAVLHQLPGAHAGLEADPAPTTASS